MYNLTIQIQYCITFIKQCKCDFHSNEEIFERNKGPYVQALKDQGHMCDLKYQKPDKTKKKRLRNVIFFFNPPFSKSVKTNVIGLFLGLIDKYFKTDNKLHNHYSIYRSCELDCVFE